MCFTISADKKEELEKRTGELSYPVTCIGKITTGEGINWLEENGEEVILDLETHTEDILLVDRWGRYRDRFKWDDPLEMERLKVVANELLRETAPPIGQVFETRNALAGVPHDKRRKSWLDEFFLTDEQNNSFYSRDLTGQVWVASFFFTSCPSICPEQNRYLNALQDRLSDRKIAFISITTDPQTDTPAKLKEYKASLDADNKNWRFLTGDKDYIRRISEEFFTESLIDSGHHTSRVFVRPAIDQSIPAFETRCRLSASHMNRGRFPTRQTTKIMAG